MTSDPFVPLSDLERDALAELSNIAMAKAANSLRQMIQNEVLLAVPSVEILTSAAATQLVAKPDNPKLVAVRQDFAGRVLRPGDADLSGDEIVSNWCARWLADNSRWKTSWIWKTKPWRKPAISFSTAGSRPSPTF